MLRNNVTGIMGVNIEKVELWKKKNKEAFPPLSSPSAFPCGKFLKHAF
jgi:hypothetical protein